MTSRPTPPASHGSRAPAVLFDLDGTLVDSEPHYYEAGRLTLERYGVTGFTWEQHSRFIGIGTRETLETLRAEYGIDAPVDELLAVKNRHYLELVRTSAIAFPGMRAFVERLHTAGHPLAVASGSSRAAIEATLEATGLGSLLTVRVSAEDVGRGKPEPDVFLEAARLLGAAPADCVVVEDSGPGVEAARRAQMRCIAVPYAPDSRTPDGDADEGEGVAPFASAGLVFAGGQREFDAQAAYAWIAQSN
ncbi:MULTISPECIES: HAD family phosphatase [unclassified Streptomyces]|uniref:HAD family phosphatase n=1 Tax=unclassified Streptomyces TaxID=2593676 RepID=UPI00336A4CE0